MISSILREMENKRLKPSLRLELKTFYKQKIEWWKPSLHQIIHIPPPRRFLTTYHPTPFYFYYFLSCTISVNLRYIFRQVHLLGNFSHFIFKTSKSNTTRWINHGRWFPYSFEIRRTRLCHVAQRSNFQFFFFTIENQQSIGKPTILALHCHIWSRWGHFGGYWAIQLPFLDGWKCSK